MIDFFKVSVQQPNFQNNVFFIINSKFQLKLFNAKICSSLTLYNIYLISGYPEQSCSHFTGLRTEIRFCFWVSIRAKAIQGVQKWIC